MKIPFATPRPPPQAAPPQAAPPEAPAPPFGAPFALPEDDTPLGGDATAPPAAGFGWAWEPPEGEQPG